MKTSITLYDIGLILLIIGMIITSYRAISFSSVSNIAIVEFDGKPVYKVSTTEENSILVRGGVGAVVIETREGEVRIKESACPGKVCVRTGWRSKGGDFIVCVPNKIVVRLLGESEHKMEGVTG